MDIPLVDDDEEKPDAGLEEDPLNVMLVNSVAASTTAELIISIAQDAFSFLSHSILSNRLMANLYLEECDYENAISIAESGLELVRKAEANTGKNLKQCVCKPLLLSAAGLTCKC